MKRKFYLFLALLTGFTIFGTGNANAQTYTCLGHDIGCTYYNGTAGPYNGYSAINNVEISSGGSSIYKKTADGCNDAAVRNSGGHYNVMGASPMFTLVAGNTYELEFNITNPAGYNGYQNYFMVYLDLNGDGVYNGTGEHISSNWNTYSSVTTHTESFTIPCTGVKDGVSRLRLRTDYQYGRLQNRATDYSALGTYGETEEFVIKLSSPSSIISTFNMPDSLFVGTTDIARYTGNGGSIWWDWENNNSVDQTGGGQFTGIVSGTVGCFDLECISENCFGKDSTVKNICIVNPPALVIPDFVADETTVTLYDDIQFFDLSDNGPTDWNWTIYDSTQNPPITYTLADNVGPSDKNPLFDFYDPGKFTVCLSGYNIFGWSTPFCKKDYITVTDFLEWDVASYWPDIEAQNGRIYDKGGVDADYENNASKFTNFLTIVPCNADKIFMTFKQFRMADDNDLVFVFDGSDVNGVPLHPAGGFKTSEWNSKVPFTLTANSGALYIYYESDGSGTDSGFIADYVSTQGSGLPPVAKIDAPDVMYNGVNNKFINSSENIGGLTTYDWTINGANEGSNKDLDYTFYTDGTYNVCLKVTTCLGDSTICKSVKVETPTDPTNTDFTADVLRPKIGEVVSYKVTNDIANNFEWSVNPPNFVFVNGTDASSFEPQMSFTKEGCYTVSLTAWNDRNTNATSRTIVKGNYICVLDYCKPSANPTTTDISINNVVIKNANGSLLNNTSTVEVGGYSDYTETHSANVLMGGTYDLEVRRNTNSDPWNGKAWIDWNVDGDFDDAGEEVLDGAMSNGNIFTSSITVPDYTKAFAGKSRMRIAVGYKGTVPTKCGPTYIGEYEDYTINIAKDNDLPVISLTGMDTIIIQKDGTFTEPGYTAQDPTQGDVTGAVITDTDLDLTKTGYYTINYNVCDNSGNCAITAVRYVKVVLDVTNPILVLTNPVINVNVNDKRACLGTMNSMTFDYAVIGASASDAVDGDLTSFIQYDNTIVDMNTVGTYSVNFWVQDIQGNKDSKTATVNVKDNFAPVIIQNGPTNIPLGSDWVEQTVACDKYDGMPVLTVTPNTTLPNGKVRGTYVVTYVATDASGNSSAAVVRTYRVDDFEAPEIFLNSSDTVYHDVNEKYYPAIPTARDNYFDADEISIIKTGEVIYKLLGTYMETYTATDPLNNKAVKTRFVKVVDRVAPQITGNSLNVPLGKEFWGQHELIVTDNYYNPETLKPLIKVISSNVNVHVVGTYSMIFQLTDPSGNQSDYFTRVVNVGVNYEQTIGLNDLDLEKNINVFPIPTYNGIVKINIKDINTPSIKANLINSLGAVVMDLGDVTDDQELDLTELSHGVYFIRFEVGSKSTLKKIILN